jgi:hypothetical protein
LNGDLAWTQKERFHHQAQALHEWMD